ncbi:alpha/beta fold hydrolase [Tabrizicola sp.]|uniref:alpha/beta fold hydrolase n=1 Tax=Tabrizicola sp. TaxID=2005166 RepID=UPI00286A502A|nr:alpha/beta fold hydrolase [Tabrizicola sp.]
MPEALIAGHPTAWRVWERGGARRVLALHCSLGHSGMWSGLAERLTGVSVTAPDLPGHGKSGDWDGREDFHALSARVATSIAELAGTGEPVDLIGHSFGATVALRIALERPDLVRSLVLVEPVIFAAAKDDPTYAPLLSEHRTVALLIANGDRAKAAALFHARWGTGEAFADLSARQQGAIIARIHLIAAQNDVLLDDTAGLLRPGGLEAIRVPVLMIEGGDSPPIIHAVQAALCARLPLVTRLIVQGAEHMVPITHPGDVARSVQMHLDAS